MYGYDIYHEKIMLALIDAVRNNQNSHAYIFEGAKGIGKRECAKMFSAVLTCMGENTPCGSCPACVQTKAGTNPDIIYVNPEKDKKTIGINPVREMVKDAYIKPFECGKKVYIIEQGDILTEQAQNAFLKILEEPSEYVVFIIVVTSASTLLQTVLSRSVLIRFPELGEEDIVKYIRRKYPEETGRAEFLAKYARGVPGVVDEIVTNEDFEPLRQGSFKMIDMLLSRKKLTAYDAVEFLEANKDNVELILDFWSDFLRDMLFVMCGEKKSIINSDMLAEIEKKSARTDEKAVVQAIEAIVHSREMLKRYISLRTVALNLTLKIKSVI